MECREYYVGESYYHIGTITAINRDECGICDYCEGALNTDTHVVCGYVYSSIGRKMEKILTKMKMIRMECKDHCPAEGMPSASGAKVCENAMKRNGIQKKCYRVKEIREEDGTLVITGDAPAGMYPELEE